MAAIAAAMAAAGCAGPASEPAARHLLLVTLDTTRPDRLGSYGHPNAGTPWLDALAARGTRFERAYAQVPLTLPSHMSILTGLYPTRTGVHANGQTSASPGVRTLAERLAAEGFFTAAAVGGYPVAARFPVRSGFEAFDDRMTDPRNPQGLERDAGEVVRAALAVMGARGSRRAFLWVHLFDPHDPYEPPSPFRERFASDLYQGEIARVDAALADLEPRLASALAGESLLACVVGDHGEALGEHGEETHGFFLYEPTVRVPLLMAGPRVPRGKAYSTPVQTVDLVPTLMSLLGLPVPSGLDGTPLDLGAGSPASPRRVYLETELPFAHYGWSPLHGAVDGHAKYVSAPRPELYDLASDPGETRSLCSERAEEAGELDAWVRRARGTGSREGGSPPMAADPRLLSLGYVGTGARGGASRTLADPKDELATYRRFQQASKALEAGAPLEALPLLDALLAESDAPGVRFQRARALRMTGRLRDAEAELRKVAAAEPDFPGIHLERCWVALDLGDPRTALAEAERHLRQDPSNAQVLMFRGAARESLGDLGGAESDYRAAHEANPAFGGASLRLAALLVRAGRISEAKEILKARLAIDPSDRLARGLLDSL
jgi:arylsulfatase A-like enzyme/Flp pilus assembly protein TadD